MGMGQGGDKGMGMTMGADRARRKNLQTPSMWT